MINKQQIWLGIATILISFSSLAVEMETDLMDRYRAAYESGKATALVDLVYPDGLDETIRSQLQEGFQFNFDLKMKLTNMSIGEVPEGMPTERNLNGVTYKLNLEPTGRLEVMLSLVDENGNELGGPNSYIVGEHEGKLYITTGVPSDN